MKYWYPAQARVAQLAAELRALEAGAQDVLNDPEASLVGISRVIECAPATKGFPKRQVGQWVWLASQVRLRASEPDIARPAIAALRFLEKVTAQRLTEERIQDLNWVLESTIQRLSAKLEPQALRSCLNSDEIARIEVALAGYDVEQFDHDEMRAAVGTQMAGLASLSVGGGLATLKSKVEALFEAALQDTAEGRTARAALSYLADEQDVVCDSHGVLGLLDDIYVIEWAYAVVGSKTLCLPLLEAMLADYPFVADLAMVGDPLRPLDRFSQYVGCNALEALFASETPTLMVLRDGAAYSCVIALLAAIESARRQVRRAGPEFEGWTEGEHVLISDGAVTLKVTFLGETTVGHDRRFRVGVRDSGSVTVPLELSPYMSKAGGTHKRLSTGNEVSEWLRARHLDPLVNLTGASRRRERDQECILLLGPRNKLDEYLPRLHPLGADPATLLGVRYVTSEGRHESLPGCTTDTPYIYACSDFEIARELVRNPPEHVGSWRLVVDGAKAGRSLFGALSSDGGGGMPPMCVVSELHDRDAAFDLLQRGFGTCYLEDADVEAPSLVPVRRVRGEDSLSRFLRRQGNHWTSTVTLEEARNPLLESLAEWMRRARVEAVDDDGLKSLELLVSNFMQRMLGAALPASTTDRAASNLIRAIGAQASVQRVYSPFAAELYAVVSPVLEAVTYDREAALRSLIESCEPNQPPPVIVCRSKRIAGEFEAQAKGDPLLGRCHWVSIEALRRIAPVARAIVPGWLDASAMRELANNGYAARLHFLLFPFEQRWLASTLESNAKWERRVSERSLGWITRLAERSGGGSANSGALWNNQTKRRLERRSPVLEVVPADEAAEVPEFETLEARAIDALHRAAIKGREHHPTAKAQLVLFEEDGAYAYLPPTGKVIVLAGRDGELPSRGAVGNDAEKMLFRSVSGLKPGFLLALPLNDDRDLVDARADQFIQGAAQVRRAAALWKTALARYLRDSNVEAFEFARRMEAAGHHRDASTIRAWVSGSHSVAPRNYKDVVPVLALLTGDAELQARTQDVLQAIDLIYRARAAAASAIVKELFAGAIDLEQDQLVFELNGATVRYALHRVRRVEGIRDVPTELLGRARRFTASARPARLPHVEAQVAGRA